MHALVKTAFARLYELDPETEEQKLSEADNQAHDKEDKLTMSVPAPNELDATKDEPVSAKSQEQRVRCTRLFRKIRWMELTYYLFQMDYRLFWSY